MDQELPNPQEKGKAEEAEIVESTLPVVAVPATTFLPTRPVLEKAKPIRWKIRVSIALLVAMAGWAILQGMQAADLKPNMASAYLYWALGLILAVVACWYWCRKSGLSHKRCAIVVALLSVLYVAFFAVLIGIQPKAEGPRFAEDVTEVIFTMGDFKDHYTMDRLRHPMGASIVNMGIRPVFYVKDDKLCADLDNIGRPGVRFRNGRLKNGPAMWDMNSDKNGMEILNEQGQVMLQIDQKTSGHVSILGLFMGTNNEPVYFATNGVFGGQTPWYVSPVITENRKGLPENWLKDRRSPAIISPIFKYPANRFPHVRIE